MPRPAIILKKYAANADWKLLLFLVAAMNVKLVVKLAALVAAFFLHDSFRSGLSWKAVRVPPFYSAMICLVLVNLFIRPFSDGYIAVACAAILFWAASLAFAYQLAIFVKENKTDRLYATLEVFFFLNMLLSAFNLILILADIGLRNPFLYQGQYQKYFLNTGDYIRGISFDTSVTNAIINCFAVLYFLHRSRYIPVLLAMTVLLLTGSNLSNLILLLALGGLFAAGSSRMQKSIIAGCGLLTVLFFAKCSPQNESYVADNINKFLSGNQRRSAIAREIPIRERPESLLTADTRREKVATLYLDSLARLQTHNSAAHYHIPVAEKPIIPGDSIHTAGFQWKRDTTVTQQKILHFLKEEKIAPAPTPARAVAGKWLSCTQSLAFMRTHPTRILTGDGAGCFSSRLAFRATGLQLAGSFPAKFTWSSPEFLANHFSLYTYFLLKHADAHSIIHSPGSVYDQLLSEYGLIGLLSFAIGYILFFLKRIELNRFTVPLSVMMLSFFAVDYWFEQLSIVIVFEFIMFIQIKEKQVAAHHA